MSFLRKVSTPFRNPLRQALDLADDLPFESEDEIDALLALFIAIIMADGEILDSEKEIVENYLQKSLGSAALKRFQSMLEHNNRMEIAEATTILKNIDQLKLCEVFKVLFNVAYSDGELHKAEEDILKEIAEQFGFKDYERIKEESFREYCRQQTMMRSGAGLLASVLIMGIFILTATYLKSVFFGLILAYFFLPMQKKIVSSKLVNLFFCSLSSVYKVISSPFTLIAASLRKIFKTDRAHFEELSQEEKDLNSEKQRQIKACHFTVASVVLVNVLIGFILFSSVFSYAEKKIDKLRKDETPISLVESPSEEANFLEKKFNFLEDKLKPYEDKIASIPGLRSSIDFLKEKIHSGEVQEKIAAYINEEVSFGTLVLTVISNLASFILNLLLTIFFFSFFLEKMVLYLNQKEKKNEGQYFVESILGSSWLPTTSPETKESAAKIINQVFDKLKIWIRGYLWIIIIETTIYVSLFLLLGVPQALLLGTIAGFTVLLPFLGPMASALITVGVCIAYGQYNPAFLVSIVAVYFIMNMIIEQLFLYPTFVGEALGLTLLETLIVVLLGGLFAGLTGVIFAVPAASILKFLIPQVYRSLDGLKQDAQ